MPEPLNKLRRALLGDATASRIDQAACSAARVRELTGRLDRIAAAKADAHAEIAALSVPNATLIELEAERAQLLARGSIGEDIADDLAKIDIRLSTKREAIKVADEHGASRRADLHQQIAGLDALAEKAAAELVEASRVAIADRTGALQSEIDQAAREYREAAIDCAKKLLMVKALEGVANGCGTSLLPVLEYESAKTYLPNVSERIGRANTFEHTPEHIIFSMSFASYSSPQRDSVVSRELKAQAERLRAAGLDL